MPIATIAWANDLVTVLSTSQNMVHGGDELFLDLYMHNNTTATVVRQLPLSLFCRLNMGQTTITRQAELMGGKTTSLVEIAVGGFARRQYKLEIPVYAFKAVEIELDTIDTNTLTIQVEKAPSEAWKGEQIPLDQGQLLAQSFLENLSVYQPMYFLLGVDPGLDQSKFQLSFKYRLFNLEGYLAEKAPWVSGFYMGYTQCSIWDLKNDSKPFDDTSYMPEIFYLAPKINLGIPSISAFGVQSGFQHESNGKGGDESRSTNYLYLQPVLGVHLKGPYYLKIAPKILTYINNSDSSNDDLADYRGHVDGEIGIIDPGGLALNSHLRWAKEGATLQLDLSYPMTKLVSKNLNLYLHFQYFSGYAETLLHYNERHGAFRLGFSIIR